MSAASSGELAGAEATKPPPYPVPGWFRWVLGFRSPWWVAAGIGCAYLVIALAFYNAIGIFDGFRLDGRLFWLHPWGSFELAYCLYFAWLPIAVHYLVLGAERDLARAGPSLELSGAALEDARRRLLAVPSRALWFGAGVGVIVAGLTVGIVQMSSEMIISVPQLIWNACRETLLDAAIFSVVAWGVVSASRLSGLARERANVRLLDPRAFAPFVQNGTRLALLWLVMWSFMVPWLFFVPVEAFLAKQLVLPVILLFAIGVVLTAIAIALPTRGVRDRIRAAKREELERVRLAIEAARAGALGESQDSREAAAQLPGLLAYERRIVEVAEWPLEAPAVRRLGLYLLIPVASWVGGALVERIVDTALG